jgi:hypothetical protein
MRQKQSLGPGTESLAQMNAGMEEWGRKGMREGGKRDRRRTLSPSVILTGIYVCSDPGRSLHGKLHLEQRIGHFAWCQPLIY